MVRYDYDVVVIGGGAAGLTASKIANGLFKRLLLVEKTNRLGGECTWTGCVPSKTLIKSAEVAHIVGNTQKWGVTLHNGKGVDSHDVMNHVRNTVKEVYQSHTPEKLQELGIAIEFGSVFFIDKHHIQCNNKTISFKSCIIATGSSPFVPPIEGLESIDYLTNETFFALEKLPESMVILGAGPIGCEMASALNRLGVHITVVEKNDRILSADDAELASKLQSSMEREGVSFLLKSTAVRVKKSENSGDFIVVYVDKNNVNHEVSAKKLLVAVGRKPNCNTLGLEKIGVVFGKRGIETNKYMQTTIPHIYACGDVVGPYLFSHMAWQQAAIAARNASIPWFKSSISYNNVCWVTFTAPELATAGLHEEQAREKYGDSVIVYKEPYTKLDRAHTDGTTEGLLKCVCDKGGMVLGVSILGARAGEVMQELQLLKTIGLPLYKLQSVIHAYPTYSELAWNISKKAYVERLENNLFVRLIKKYMQR